MSAATGLDPLARQWIEGVVAGSPVAKALGVEVVDAQVDAVTMRIPFDPELTTLPDTLHGGVIATLVDIVGAASSASGVGAEDGATGGATSRLSVTYLAPARSDLEAQATVVHRSRSTTETWVSVRDTDGRLVATGQVSSRIFH